MDEPEELNLGDNVIIVSEHDHQKPKNDEANVETKPKSKKKIKKKVKRKVVKKRRVRKK